jgi:hypothetical protein
MPFQPPFGESSASVEDIIKLAGTLSDKQDHALAVSKGSKPV